MAATAAHLVDAVIPRVPMRQRVLSPPKRLRPALRADAALTTRVLRTFIDAIEQALCAASRVPAANARLGAISFVQRFGAALDEHWHFHVCVSDVLFTGSVDGRLQLIETQVDVAAAEAVQAEVRHSQPL